MYKKIDIKDLKMFKSYKSNSSNGKKAYIYFKKAL